MKSLASRLALLSLLVLAGVGANLSPTPARQRPPRSLSDQQAALGGDQRPCSCRSQQSEGIPSKQGKLNPKDLPCNGTTIKCDPGQTPICTNGKPECWTPKVKTKSRAEYEAALLRKVTKRKVTPADVKKKEFQAILKAGRYKNEKEKIDVTFSLLPE